MRRFGLRLDKELHDELRKESFEKDVSMNTIIVSMLEERYAKTDKQIGGNK